MPYPGLLPPEPLPCSSPLLTRTSTGDTQTLKDRSGLVSVGSPGAQCFVPKLIQDWRDRLLEGTHKKNLVHTRNQEKGAVTPQETDPDLPVSVQESLAQLLVGSGLLQGRGH